jgi:predicted porin
MNMFKKSLFVLVTPIAFATAACAQSTVTVYGIMDAGIVRETGGPAGSVMKLQSGQSAGSRLGFKGVEDLGGGMSANFLLESNLAIDTGSSADGLLFGRQAFVGLNGGFGAVTLGRQYTSLFMAMLVADPFATGFAGKTTNLLETAGVRMNNTLKYVTPSVSGLSGDISYGFGERAGDNSADRAIGTAVNYANGPLNLKLVYHKLNTSPATAAATTGVIAGDAKSTLLAANYNLGPAILYGAFGVNKAQSMAGADTVDNRSMLVGVSVPFGASTVLASYIRKDDKLPTNLLDVHQVALGYTYSLSKRTLLYTSYARVNNRAALLPGNQIGSGDTSYNAGIRQTF